MESNVEKPPMLEQPFRNSDAKYISGLSTILVASIQEAKDKISQIESIFCDQLYPNLQFSPQSLQKIYSEAKEAAEGAYKQNEKDLLLQIEKLSKENQLLMLEKKKIADMERQSFDRIEELQKELNQKTMEADEGVVVCQNLQNLLESKSTLLHNYEMTIGELEGKNTMLLKMQKKVDVGAQELKQEIKEAELMSEKRKNMDVIPACKKLKSQYSHPFNKCDLTPETGLSLYKNEDEREIIRCNRTPVTSRENKKIYACQHPIHDLDDEEDEECIPATYPRTQQQFSGQGQGGRGSKPKAPTFAIHFTKVPKPGGIKGIHFKAICNYCKRKYEYNKGGGHVSLNKHTRKVHPDKWGITSSQTQLHLETFGVTSKTCDLHVMENDIASGIVGDNQLSEGEKRGLFVQKLSPISPSTSNNNIDPKSPANVKSCPTAATKPHNIDESDNKMQQMNAAANGQQNLDKSGSK